MDKSKSKDNLRAAGKKRLEEFRQKKQQKSGPTKNTSTALKVLAEEEKLLSSASSSPRTPHHGGAQLRSEESDNSLDGSISSTGEVPSRNSSINDDNHLAPADTSVNSEIIQHKSHDSSKKLGVHGSLQTSTPSGLREERITTEVGSNEGTADTSLKSISSLETPPAAADFDQYPRVNVRMESKTDGEVSHAALPQHNMIQESGAPEEEVLDRQTETLDREKEQLGIQASSNAEATLKDTSEVKSLIAEIEFLQLQLRIAHQEKVQLREELQSSNNQAVIKLQASHEEGHEAKHRKLLSQANLEAVGLELAKVRSELVNLVETTGELATRKDSELGQFQTKIESLGEENIQLASELETFRRVLQSAELEKDRLKVEKESYLQEAKDVADRNNQLVRELRESVEKSQTLELTLEHQTQACRLQILSIETDNRRLAEELDTEKGYLHGLKAEKAQLLMVLHGEREKLSRFGDGTLELAREVEALKRLVHELRCEKSSFSSNFGSELKIVGIELQKVEAALAEQANHVIGSREEYKRVSEENVRSISKLESELLECSKMVDHITEEKVKITEELSAVKLQLSQVTEEKALAIVNFESELQESKELLSSAEEDKSALAQLYEDAKMEMQRVIEEKERSFSELEAELEKQRQLFRNEIQEKERLRAELHEVQVQMEALQLSVKNHQSEIDKHDEELKQLEEDRSRLSSELFMSRDELRRLQEDKNSADMALVTLKQETGGLEETYSACMKALEDTEVELRRVRDHGLEQSTELEFQLEKEKEIRSELSEDNHRLTRKLQDLQERLEVLQLEMASSVKNHESERLKHEEHLKQMGEDRTKVSSELCMSRDEVTQLQEEKAQAELELVSCKEELSKLEEQMAVILQKHIGEVETQEVNIRELEKSHSILKNLNKDIGVELADAKHRENVHVQAKAVLLSEHRSEIETLQEQLNLLESLNAVSRADILQLLGDLETVRKEKDVGYRHVDALKEECKRLGEENLKLANDLIQSEDQRQVCIRDEELRQSELRTELQTYKEQTERLGEDKMVLSKELDALQEHLRGFKDQKVNEVESLLKQVEELSQSKEQAVSELSAAFQRAEKVERTRMDLVSKLEAAEQQLEGLSKNKDSLITVLDTSRQQLKELEEEKTMLLSSFELSVNKWEGERTELQMALGASEEAQIVLAAEKDGLASGLATVNERLKEMQEGQTLANAKIDALKLSIQASDEEKLQALAHLTDKDQQLQNLVEENNRLTSELQEESARLLVLTEDVARLTEELNSHRKRVEGSEVELELLRTECKLAQDQPESLIQEKAKHSEDVLGSKEVLKLATGDSQSQPDVQSTEDRFSTPEGAGPSVEELQGLKQQIETKEGELLQLRSQHALLETQLESSDGERHNLAQELETLRHQLQQLSESKSHVADEIALGVEASRQRMLEYEEAKSESGPDLKKSKQDLQALLSKELGHPSTEDDPQVKQDFDKSSPEVVPEPSTLDSRHGASPAHTNLKRSSMSKSDDSIIGLGSGVSKLIGEFERKAHAGHEQAEQLRKAVHENIRLTASVQRLESERHMLVEAPAQIADLEIQLEELSKQISELQIEKDAAVEGLLAAQEELRQSKDVVKGENNMLADRLEVLEESVISLNTEKDIVAGILVDVEKSLLHGPKHALQKSLDEGLAFEFLPNEPSSDALGEVSTLASKDLDSLIQKLEDAVLATFPDSAPELASLRRNNRPVLYCDRLCDKLLTGDNTAYHQLENMRLQLTEIRQKLGQAEEKWSVVEQERDLAVQAHDRTRQHLEQVVEEKEQHESFMKRVQADLNAEIEELVNKRERATQEDAEELARHNSEKASAQAEVSSLQERISDLEAALTMETKSRSSVNDDLRIIISKHWGDDADVEFEIKNMQQRHQAREVELNNLSQKVEEAAGTIAQQSEEIEGLLIETQRLSQQMEKINGERESLESGLAQAEQRLSVTREKLSMAVSKGKAVVQQRDALKLALAEKTELLDSLKAAYEQDLELKNVALESMERKLNELQASKEDFIKVEARCSFLQAIVTGTEKVLQDSDIFVEGLSRLLGSSMSSNEWHTLELVEKIVWITSGSYEVLQMMKSARDELESVTSSSTGLAVLAEEAKARADMLAGKLSNLQLEKEGLVSHLEEMKANFQLELEQKTDEKAQLTSLIKQLDSHVAALSQSNENLNRKLEEQATDLVRFEGEITSLQKKLANQEQEWQREIVSHRNLESNVYSIAKNLLDIHQSLPPFEGDITSAESSLAWCKEFMHTLVGRYNFIADKLNCILRDSAEWTSAAERDSPTSTSRNPPGEELTLRVVSTDLVKEVDEIFSLVEKQAGEATTLLRRIEVQAGALAAAESEKERLQRELANAEQRLLTIRGNLSSAVTKGKSLVQQRDALKQALAGQNDELESRIMSHQREVELKDAVLHETVQKLDAAVGQIDCLENELASFKASVLKEVDLPSVDKLRELENVLAEIQLKANHSEVDAQNAREGANLASSQVERCQKTIEELAAQVNALTQEKDELFHQLENSKALHRDEIQELIDKRAQLVSTIGELESIIDRQKEDMENLMRNFEELNDTYNSLNAQSIEDATETTNLQDEINSLHNHIAELELSMEMEAAARQKLEADSDAVVASIQEVTQEGWEDKSVGLLGKSSAGSDTTSLLEDVSNVLIGKYKAVVQEVEELSEQVALLSNLEETSKAKTFSEQESLSRMQDILDSKDLELSELSKRMEEAAIDMAQQEDIVQGLMQQVNKLRGELVKANGERDALQSELVLGEQRSASTREKLSLAVKKGKNVVQQRDALKQSLAEQELLVAKCREELESKESTFTSIKHEMFMSGRRVQALEAEVASLSRHSSTLEKDLQEKNHLIQALEARLVRFSTANDWQSKKLTDKVDWLVSDIADAERKASLSRQEVEALKKESIQLGIQLRDAQTRTEGEKEATSILRIKLEKTENELQWSHLRTAELEAQLPGLALAHQQAAALSDKIRNLEDILEQKQTDIRKAEEAVFAWAGRSEETEAYIHGSQLRISELESQLQTLSGVQNQVDHLSNQVKILEDVLQQKQSALKVSEASRTKVVNKLTITVNKFRELCQQSEGLVTELERVQGTVDSKDVTINQLKEEVKQFYDQARLSQEKLDLRNSLLLQLDEQLERALPPGNDLEFSLIVRREANANELEASTEEEDLHLPNLRLIGKRLEAFVAQSQSWQAELTKKDAQLQGLRKELEEANGERVELKTSLQREQSQIERLKEEYALKYAPAVDRDSLKVEEIEEVQVGKRSMPSTSAAPHVRGTRKAATFDVAIDMDSESSRLLEVSDEKGHGFKSLATARFMPRGTRFIADRIDRLCVAGGRVLMRQPGARLGLTLYWLAIHIWMALLLATAHV